MLKKVTLLLPLTFNDGTSVPEALLEQMEEEVFVAFNGWTAVGEVSGAYRMAASGAKQVDRLLQVWVVTPEMYFEVGEGTVEFVPRTRPEDPS